MAETRKAVETVWRDDLRNIFKRELSKELKTRYDATVHAAVEKFLAQSENIGHEERPSRSSSVPKIKASPHEPTSRSKAKS